MSATFLSRVGGTLSADIAVPEHQRELRFYSRVLCTGEKPLWREDLKNNRGMPIIGLGERIPEYSDLPLQWMPHIQVADVATSVECALELGGSELLHGKNDEGISQWAVLLDPHGAAFGIIPVVSPELMPQSDDTTARDTEEIVGCIAWLDLTVADASDTRDFYRHVVGWSVQEVDMEDGDEAYYDFNMLGDDGSPAAGICHARGVNLGLPASWIIYLPVGDLGESLRRVEEEGGAIIKATKNSDGAYASAVIQDTVGACLALVAV